ncbi:MFS transporter [Streptomyces sp. NPDC005722]
MRKWLPLLTVCLGTFMLLVDVTIVNVALPSMAEDLDTSFGSLQWVIDGYALALAALLLGAGALADRRGHRPLYVLGLAVFAAASLACAFAPSATGLVVARVVQGVGAAAMFATTFALLNSNYTGRDRGHAYGVWAAVAGAASAAGPLLGGPLTQALTWHAIFLVNLPVCVLAIVLCAVAVEDTHAPEKRHLDLTGLVTFTASAAAITFGLIEADEAGWSGPRSWLPTAAGAVMLALFARAESRARVPLLDLRLLRNRVFAGVLLVSFSLSAAAFVSFTYTSIWLQSVAGLSPVSAGLVGLPMSAAAFVVSLAVGRVLHRWHAGPTIAVGLALIGVGNLTTWFVLGRATGAAALLPGYLVVGLGVGLIAPTLNSTGMAAVPAQRGGMAAGAVNTARQLGAAFGIALLGSVFAAGVRSSLNGTTLHDPGALATAVASGQAGSVLADAPAAARDTIQAAFSAAAVHGIRELFLVSAVIGLVVAAVTPALIVRRPKENGRPVPSSPPARPARENAPEPGSGADATGRP